MRESLLKFLLNPPTFDCITCSSCMFTDEHVTNTLTHDPDKRTSRQNQPPPAPKIVRRLNKIAHIPVAIIAPTKEPLLNVLSLTTEDAENVSSTPTEDVTINTKNFPSTSTKETEDVKQTPTSAFVIPSVDAEDYLFWAMYIILKGHKEFELCSNRAHTASNCKIEWLIEIKNNKTAVKSLAPMKITMRDVEDNLNIFEPRMNIASVMALSAVFQKHVMFVFDTICTNVDGTAFVVPLFVEYFPAGAVDKTVYIVKHSIDTVATVRAPKYKHTWSITEVQTNSPDIINIRNTIYEITNLNKPVLAASGYKIADLMEIAAKLGIHLETKKYLKKDMYAILQNVFSQVMPFAA